MKKILFVGNITRRDIGITKIFDNTNYKIYKTADTKKAAKLFQKNSPDFVLCAGKFRQTSDGNYFIEL